MLDLVISFLLAQDYPGCFMVDGRGRQVALDYCVSQPATQEAPKGVMVGVYEFSGSNVLKGDVKTIVIKGFIRNTSNETKFPQTILYRLNAEGQLLGEGKAYVTLETGLRAGEQTNWMSTLYVERDDITPDQMTIEFLQVTEKQ